MCYTCGCKMPYENHGDDKNLVEKHFKESGDTEAIGGKGKKTAKDNTMELLEIEKRLGETNNPRKDYNGL